MRNIKILLFVVFGVGGSFFAGCTDNTTTFYIDKPEMLKRDKIAVFYGSQSKKNCELYKKLNAGFCDTTSQPFVTCYDLNDKKYKLSYCE